MGDLMVIHAKTDGSSTTGTFSLESDAFSNEPTYIQIPKGFKLKIWSISLDGEAVAVDVQVSRDAGSNYTTIRRVNLQSAGNLNIEKRSRPLVVVGSAHQNDYVRFTWTQSTAAESHVTLVVEIAEAEDT